MADEEKEKQEKLAAAKKRFEQLKKEQQKKGKKSGGGKKKKEEEYKAKKDVEEAEAEVEKSQEDGDRDVEAAKGEEAVKEDEAADEEEKAESESAKKGEEPAKDDEAVADGNADANDAVKQSMQRSESFRKEASGPSAEVQELYRKQSARIAELEKENKSLQSEHEASAARASQAEEKLESAREASSDIDSLRQKANDADKLKEELESTKRQLSQAQHKAGNRRQSTASPSDHGAQLASKTAAIENLELEISKLRNQVEGLQRSDSEKDTATKDLEERVKAADAAAESAKQELEQLRVSISFPSEEKDKPSDGNDPEALQKRISLLEHDVRTANTAADAASARASQLEDKITALTKLHREAVNASQNKDTELGTLREKLKRRDAGSHVRGGDADEFEVDQDETETGILRQKIRELEAENHEIRSGQWRERRAELQPGMEAHDDGYEDVDLHASTSHRGSLPRQSSTFQDVLTSGINAFTGRQSGRHGPTSPRHERKMSEGLLEDDEGEFDEGAWRQAQEEEAKRRVERVKEIKRDLEQWKGWRVDMRGLRMGGLPGREAGGVFEV